MPVRVAAIVKRFQDPRFTGPNRCLPCTIVNGAILLVVAGIIVVIEPILSILVLVLGASVIALRGYLIPGTPTLTARYLPASILQYFDHHREQLPDTEEFGENAGYTLEELLLEIDAIETCEEDDLCMTDSFRDAWHSKVGELDGQIDVKRFADAISIPEEEIQHRNELLFIQLTPGRQQQWGSKLAIISDIAAAEIIQSRLPLWEELPIEEKRAVLEGLRVFIDECPVCGQTVSIIDEETTIGCCQRAIRYVVRCDHCDDVFMHGDPMPA